MNVVPAVDGSVVSGRRRSLRGRYAAAAAAGVVMLSVGGGFAVGRVTGAGGVDGASEECRAATAVLNEIGTGMEEAKSKFPADPYAPDSVRNQSYAAEEQYESLFRAGTRHVVEHPSCFPADLVAAALRTQETLAKADRLTGNGD